MKETLKKLRIENRYSQDLLAKVLGVSRLSYMKYESGEVEPPLEIVRKLSKIYKVSYKILIDNELCEEHKTVTYEYGQAKEYSVASPAPAYTPSVGSNFSESPNIIFQFQVMLSELQKKISEMQTQINLLEKTPALDSDFKKSKSFNKNEFFSKIGSVQIDSSYIDELRGASLI